jgi:hypothetical protein
MRLEKKKRRRKRSGYAVARGAISGVAVSCLAGDSSLFLCVFLLPFPFWLSFFFFAFIAPLV